MKKYLSLAAVLGAVAVLSVSYLAQAQTGGAAPAPAAAEKAAPAAMPAPPALVFAKDYADCDTLASAASTEGAAMTAEAKAEAVKKCLLSKGHTEEEISREEALRGHAADKAPATGPVPPGANDDPTKKK